MFVALTRQLIAVFMKKHFLNLSLASSFLFTFLLFYNSSFAQSSRKDKNLVADAVEAKAEFIRVDGMMQSLFDNAYGYVIFPNVGKGGMGIGGAAGNGVVYEQGNLIGKAKLTQVS